MKTFADAAGNLAKNPLGIIALFLVLVYGLASLVLVESTDAIPLLKLGLGGFLVLFPFAVLYVFYNLVTNHHMKLYAPGDFPDPEDFLRTVETHLGKVETKTKAFQVFRSRLIAGDQGVHGQLVEGLVRRFAKGLLRSGYEPAVVGEMFSKGTESLYAMIREGETLGFIASRKQFDALVLGLSLGMAPRIGHQSHPGSDGESEEPS